MTEASRLLHIPAGRTEKSFPSTVCRLQGFKVENGKSSRATTTITCVDVVDVARHRDIDDGVVPVNDCTDTQPIASNLLMRNYPVRLKSWLGDSSGSRHTGQDAHHGQAGRSQGAQYPRADGSH